MQQMQATSHACPMQDSSNSRVETHWLDLLCGLCRNQVPSQGTSLLPEPCVTHSHCVDSTSKHRYAAVIAADLRVTLVGLLAKRSWSGLTLYRLNPKTLCLQHSSCASCMKASKLFCTYWDHKLVVEELKWRLTRPGVLSNRYCVKQISRAPLHVTEHAGINACMKYSIV